ncbi:MAG TPA: hypothetical protein VMW18_05165 [Candidatus Binatia bacterium]|nr:hypothetical protein [Candidatus Binatia bacterium]
MPEAAAGYLDALLAEFVNREDEVKAFIRLLEDGTRTVLAVWGEGGVGKTSLQAKMKHELALRSLRKAEIAWNDTYNYDYLAIMRKLRDDCGVDHFKSFTDLVNYFTVPEYNLNINLQGGVNVLQDAKLENTQVRDITGIVIKDLMLDKPRTDKDVPEAERVMRLTDAFIPGLAAATAGAPFVIFMDAAEKMADKTRSWIWDGLLTHARDGKLPGVKFVICGRAEPKPDASFKYTCQVRQLQPLKLEHIEAYLEKRGLKQGREFAMLLLAVSKGNILELSNQVDAYLNLMEAAQGR